MITHTLKTTFWVTSMLALGLFPASSHAGQLLFNQDINPDVIFGSGNANGAWTVNHDLQTEVELGLRAKLRFDATNQPQNIFNSNGDGTYTFAAGLPPTGFSFAPNSTSTAVWNFEWSINSNVDGVPGDNLSGLTYLLQIDFDPTAGTNFLSFDPINQTIADHAIGDNGTLNGGGVSAVDAADYAALIAANNVAQNSWNMEFFDDPILNPFNGGVAGEYTFVLTAFDESVVVASTTIVVNSAVPEPATSLAFGMIGLIAGAGVWRRRNRSA